MKQITIALLSLIFMACSSAPKDQSTGAKDAAAPAAKKETVAAKAKEAVETAKEKTKAVVAKTAGDSTNTVCTYNDVKREIALVQSGESCVVNYTKDGDTKEIATGLPNSKHCDEVAARVKSTLEGAGYKCE